MYCVVLGLESSLKAYEIDQTVSILHNSLSAIQSMGTCEDHIDVFVYHFFVFLSKNLFDIIGYASSCKSPYNWKWGSNSFSF